jgi:hypothetical protein
VIIQRKPAVCKQWGTEWPAKLTRAATRTQDIQPWA